MTVEMEDIPIELILNWDQTGIKIGQWSSKCVEMSCVNDKRQITTVFCGNLSGEFLPIQVIYQGKTN